MKVDNGTEEISYHHIVQALKSVLDQTNQEFEILVVDDGSTDDSLQWAKSVQSPKIRIFEQENQGVSVARNVGIENARGTYILFLDADDVWHPDYLQMIHQLTENIHTVIFLLQPMRY